MAETANALSISVFSPPSTAYIPLAWRWGHATHFGHGAGMEVIRLLPGLAPRETLHMLLLSGFLAFAVIQWKMLSP